MTRRLWQGREQASSSVFLFVLFVSWFVSFFSSGGEEEEEEEEEAHYDASWRLSQACEQRWSGIHIEPKGCAAEWATGTDDG